MFSPTLFQPVRVGELGQAYLAQGAGDTVAEDAHDLAAFADAVAGQRADGEPSCREAAISLLVGRESGDLREVEFERRAGSIEGMSLRPMVTVGLLAWIKFPSPSKEIKPGPHGDRMVDARRIVVARIGKPAVGRGLSVA